MIGVYWEGPNEKYATDWPQIGKVVDIINDVLIHWYNRSIDGLPLGKSREGTEGCKKVAWIDKIPNHVF